MTNFDHAGMQPISPAHRRLGAVLREARLAAGINVRSVPKSYSKRPFYSAAHISLVENGLSAPSRELVLAYIAFGTVPAAKLIALHDQAKAKQDEADRRRRGVEPHQDAQPPKDVARRPERWEVQQHYIVETNTATCVFDRRGVMREMTCTAALRATSPEVWLAYTGHSYLADPRPGVLRIEPLAGADLETTRESDLGTLQSYFRLHRALNPDDEDPYLFSFRLTVDSAVRSAPRLRFQAEEGNRQLILRAVFTAPALPRQLWWVEAQSGIDADYPNAERIIQSDSADFCRTFDHLVPTWLYGYGWTW